MTYKIGDTVVNWTYGPGKIVGIDNKGLPGQPSSYMVASARTVPLGSRSESYSRFFSLF